MRFSLFRQLLTSLPLALLASAAQAQSTGENQTEITQTGADNIADIDQAGVLNVAGTEDFPMLQDGFWNQIRISQTGRSNQIGTEGSGLQQQGLYSSPTVYNILSITQNSNGNLVGSVDQRSLGSVPNGANTLTVEQSGAGGNRISLIIQRQETGQARQIAVLRQTGSDNLLVQVSQYASTVVQLEPNQIYAEFSGDRNGRTALTRSAALPTLQDNSLSQEAGSTDSRSNGNDINLLIFGNDNAFGIRQAGRMNSVGTITISGNFNEMGLRQDGDENDIMIVSVDGNENNIGIDQLGTNLATLNLVGFSSDNEIYLRQQGANDAFVSVDGDGNLLSAAQDYLGGLGGENTLDAAIVGDDNAMDIRQFGENDISLTVTGDDNNTARAFSSALAGLGLAPGTIEQAGFDNKIEGTVTGSSNAFAALQLGELNVMSLTISGDDNEALLSQLGNRNTAVLSQTGSGNSAQIRQ